MVERDGYRYMPGIEANDNFQLALAGCVENLRWGVIKTQSTNLAADTRYVQQLSSDCRVRFCQM